MSAATETSPAQNAPGPDTTRATSQSSENSASVKTAPLIASICQTPQDRRRGYSNECRRVDDQRIHRTLPDVGRGDEQQQRHQDRSHHRSSGIRMGDRVNADNERAHQGQTTGQPVRSLPAPGLREARET
jgi:hypothetical protein